MPDPIIPDLDQLKKLWAAHCSSEAARFGDHRRAAAHNQSRIGFDLKMEELRREAANQPTGGFTIRLDADDPDTAIVTNARGRARRIHREDADPEHRFTDYRLAAGWFANMPAADNG